jgi:hypothetical protein
MILVAWAACAPIEMMIEACLYLAIEKAWPITPPEMLAGMMTWTTCPASEMLNPFMVSLLISNAIFVCA